VLSMANLADPAVRDGVRDLLAQVDRSSGSSGWLKDAVIANPDAYDAMFNYESLVLEADQALAAAGQEPLYIIYPANGLSVADSPLGLISRGDVGVDAAFAALQTYLLTPGVQDQITLTGRRAGLIGMSAAASTAPIWNTTWGVDLTRNIAPVPTPSAEVIREALRLYQTELRKPSLTIWVLDVSGSMDGAPLTQLKDAMTLLLDPQAASLNLLQPSDRDITIILPFNSVPLPSVTVVGGTAADLAGALRMVRGLQAGGGTDLYAALGDAFALLEPYARAGTLDDYLPAIVAMTDGASDTGNRAGLLANIARLPFGRDVPVHAVSFGDADVAQLDELNAATIGRLFDGNADLAEALRSAKGYN
jgi:Ca-activated chloride channel homolog